MSAIIKRGKQLILSGSKLLGISEETVSGLYRKVQIYTRWILFVKLSLITGHTAAYRKFTGSINMNYWLHCGITSDSKVIDILSLMEYLLKFNTFDKPVVSIVIPVFNNIWFTLTCLKSIYDCGSSVAFEIIVIDDCSSDRTGDILKKIEGIRVIRNSENYGFIGSCNHAAREARGEFILFLGNDTVVKPGWLEAMVGTFTDFPDAGLVGAKFLFPDGRLQDAGGMIFNDGSAMHYGRGDDPQKPQYNYLREVDYCSGACLMIRRDLFLSLGSFDECYTPAYYEDVDLAFKIRKAGRKVLYQPCAEIIHFEGVTSGTDISIGIKKRQQINKSVFFERWKEVLKSHAESGCNIEHERERYSNKHILVIDVTVPMPDWDAGSLRMFNILKIIVGLSHKVSFFTYTLTYIDKYVKNLQSIGVEVLMEGSTDSFLEYLRTHGRKYDVVIISRLDVALRYVDPVLACCPNAFAIFDTVDLHFLREMREANVQSSPEGLIKAEKRKRQELGVASKVDLTVVVSPVEKEIIFNENPLLSVEVVSLIHEIRNRSSSFNERRNIMFIGGFLHKPNVDAMIYFVNEIFPVIRKTLPDVEFYIVGSNPPDEIKALAGNGVIVTGFVEDVGPLFEHCRLSVAPLRYGAGVKGKVNQSMSYGLPVVATPVAVEGMFLNHEENVLVASTPQEFADAVIRLYTDEELWKKISDNSLENIRSCFSFEVARRSIEKILEMEK